MKTGVSAVAILLSLSSFAWGWFGPSAKDVERAFMETIVSPKNERIIMSSVKATKTERDGIWRVTYSVIQTRFEYVHENGSVSNVVKKASPKRSVFDNYEGGAIVRKDVEETVEYQNYVSATKKNGKVVLMYLKVR